MVLKEYRKKLLFSEHLGHNVSKKINLFLHKEEMTLSAYSHQKNLKISKVIDFFLGKNHCEESYRWHYIKILYKRVKNG